MPLGTLAPLLGRVGGASGTTDEPGTAGPGSLPGHVDGGSGAPPAGNGGGNSGQKPQAFVWNGDYYNLTLLDNPEFDMKDRTAIDSRFRAAIAKHMRDYEGEEDFAIISLDVRRVDPRYESDLLAMNPGAEYIGTARGRNGKGVEMWVPAVMGHDATTWVDPFIGRR